MSTVADVLTLARLVKQRARSVERSVHELRALAAQLEEAAAALPDTSQEDTDAEEPARSYAHA